MVSGKTQRGKAVRTRTPFLVKCGVFIIVVIMGVLFVNQVIKVATLTPPINYTQFDEQIADEATPPIDFQPVVNDWVNATNGKKGVVIYDLELDKIVGQYNADQKFDTASLYKLFVVYEGYKMAQDGLFDLNKLADGANHTISECLSLAISESHSPCAEALWGMIGADELDRIVREDFGISGLTVSDLEATPIEIMQIMKLFYEHPDIKDGKLLDKIWDSFLNQPVTTYNWRQGLPSGFSDKVNVYNKVGWNWNGEYWAIYNDAAILSFVKEDRHFIVVVMTSEVSYQAIRDLGRRIEEAFYTQNVLKN